MSQRILVNIQSFNTHCSVISKVKIFKRQAKLQGQVSRVKIVGTHGEVLLQEIFIEISKYQSFSIHCLKVVSKVKVSDRITELWTHYV